MKEVQDMIWRTIGSNLQKSYIIYHNGDMLFVLLN